MTASLLATKLLIPPTSIKHVRRPRLCRQLDGSLGYPLTLVSAPAGYGKTALLSDWAQQVQDSVGPLAPQRVAWVALDAADDDPAHFWNYVLVALNEFPEVYGQLAGNESELLSPGNAGAVEARLVQVFNLLAQSPIVRQHILILDDFQTITSASIHNTLAILLEHLPSCLHVVVSSRADPPLALARLRVSGNLLEMRAADLRFGQEEADEFLNSVMQLQLTQPQLLELSTRSEGWVAGLQLAALSLKGRDNKAEIIRDFSGQHHFVLDYLVEEVVACQPAAVQLFLEQTSILEKLNADLCQAVTGQPQSAELLAYLFHNNLFTEPLDENSQWFRRHHLLAEVLAAQLQRSQPELIPILHRRACQWYSKNGFLHEAVKHGLAAGMFEWLADTVEREFRHLIALGEFSTLHSWLDALPAHVIVGRPRCWLAYAWSSIYSGRVDALERYLTMAESASQGALGNSDEALQGEILVMRALVGSIRGEIAITARAAQQALTLMSGTDDGLLALAHIALGNVHRICGRPNEAVREFEAALPLTDRIGLFATIAANGRLGQVRAMQGRHENAVQLFKRVIELASDESGPSALFCAEAHIHLGDIYRERNQLDDALKHVNLGIDMAKRAENIVATFTGYFTLLHVQAAHGNLLAAYEVLQQIEKLAAHYDFPHLAERVALHKTWLGLLAENDGLVDDWEDGYRTRTARTPRAEDRLFDFDRTLFARLLIRQHQYEEALVTLTQTEQEARTAGRMWTVAMTLVLQSLALAGSQHTAAALETLGQALTMAAPEGMIRVFIDEGETVWKLLANYADPESQNRIAQNFAAKLLWIFETTISTSRGEAPHPFGMAETLSAREQDVLRLAAFGASNQAIAEALVISVGTVKSHMNRILSKLSAQNRTEAVARAREYRLI